MIDTHCHLLPALDDGPRHEADGVLLARELAAQGVRRVLCTPHYSRLFPTSHADAEERLSRFQPVLRAEGVELELSLAAEIGPGLAVSAPLEELLIRTIDGRFALIELLGDTSPAAIVSIGERFVDAGVRLVLAHPERCRAVQRHLNVLDPFRADGVLLQVVAPSLLGRWGPEVEATAWHLVDTGRADLLGSDAHSTRRRRPHLSDACELIEERLGGGVVAELTERRPRLLLDGDAY
ncbi:MAG TPA: CpsB/CapC family capsule biosynthesis tyrosine phosphatase [Gaiellaceae bacterium]|nr:CpsB/CapC family capsule biosynthesis tyrosine phosphatase [Gaiellaceae bacterium]